MDKQVLEMLGLFTVPPTLKIRDKEERALEKQLMNQHMDFFDKPNVKNEKDNMDPLKDSTMFIDQKDAKKQKDLEKLAQRREKHLQQMDATKKMYIDQILQRNVMCSFEGYWDLIENSQPSGEGSTQFHRQEQERRRLENERKHKQQQDLTYYDKLTEIIEVYNDPKYPNQIELLKIDTFPLLISNMDVILKAFHENNQPILELCLNSTFLTASECLVLAENPQSANLRKLDLACNPITAKGLLYLVHPSHSKFTEKLQSLSLFNCEIDHAQTYLISNDHLQNSKCNFNLKYLNLSYNNLGNFLNYINEFELINPDLQTLLLNTCQLNDEQILNMATSVTEGGVQKIISLENLDISHNQLGQGFILFMRQVRESCDFLKNLICEGNSGIRHTQSMQIAKSKKLSESPNMILRLDLSNCLRNDEQVAQLAQSSYLKDLKWLNLRHCKFGTDGFNELLSSKNLRSLEVLIVKDNKIRTLEGPFSDLEDATEKQIKKGIMKLQILDIRGNRLTKIFLKEAVSFLKDTVVLMWDNPFEINQKEDEANDIFQEFYDPASLFRSGQLDDDYHLIQSPMHIYLEPFSKHKEKLNEYLKSEFESKFGMIFDQI